MKNNNLFDLSADEVEKAIAIFRRCHNLLYGKMGAALVKSMKKPILDDGGEMGRARKEGYLKGRDIGLGCFPSDIKEIPMGEILKAVYGSEGE